MSGSITVITSVFFFFEFDQAILFKSMFLITEFHVVLFKKKKILGFHFFSDFDSSHTSIEHMDTRWAHKCASHCDAEVPLSCPGPLKVPWLDK